MIRTTRLLTGSAVLAAGLVVSAAQTPPSVIVVLETEKGAIAIEVDVARAPVTAANFLKYVDGGFYDGGRFQRAVRPDTERRTDYPIAVIQGGRTPVPGRGRGRAQAQGTTGGRAGGQRGFPAIPLERTRDTGILHKDGVISMARSGPDSATSDFFICIGDQPELDFGGRRNADGQGFAAFGRVVSGMEAVRAIQSAPVREGSETLMPPIAITRASRR